MLITIRENNSDVRVIVEEKIELDEVTKLLKLLEGNIGFNVTLDMTKVGNVNADIAEMVIAAKKAIKSNNSKLCLISPPQAIVEMLSRSDFDGEFCWP